MYKVMNWKGFILIIAIILMIFLPLYFHIKGMLNSQEEKKTAGNIQLSQEEELNQKLQVKLEKAGSNESIAERAIQNGYVKNSDIRFEIANPDALKLYTEEESRILFQEMAD